jgi:acyl dehydratase
MATSLDDLLARRVDKVGEVAVSSGDVLRWSEAHRVRSPRHWPDRRDDWVAPPAMVTSFVRPLEWRPDREGPPGDRGSTLHEALKAHLGIPLGIAAGYELELHALLRDGDEVVAVERIASVGEPEVSRLGPGRRWVIENAISRVGDGALVAVERFHMLGYDPAAPVPSPPAPPGADRDPGRDVPPPSGERVVEERDVGAVAIVMGASANRVWTPAHVDVDAAHAAGIADMFLDTSTQLGLLSVVGGRAAHDDSRPGRLSLRMRRPVLRGDHLRIEATAAPVTVDSAGVAWAQVDVRATVEGELRSSLTGRYAVPGGDTADPWVLGPDRWHP